MVISGRDKKEKRPEVELELEVTMITSKFDWKLELEVTWIKQTDRRHNRLFEKKISKRSGEDSGGIW